MIMSRAYVVTCDRSPRLFRFSGVKVWRVAKKHHTQPRYYICNYSMCKGRVAVAVMPAL